MKFSAKDFFSKCDQIRRNMRIWSHLLKKSLMENLIFCAVSNRWLNWPYRPAKNKYPNNMVRDSGANDDWNNRILSLEGLVKENVPDCNLWLWTPTNQFDNRKAKLTMSQLTNLLLKFKHFNRKRPNLDESGSKCLPKH